MLQIISGKFFTSDKRHRFEGKEVLYSNLTWIASIESSVVKLEPLGLAVLDISPYLISYTNQIEDDGPRAGVLVRTGDAEIVRQFQLLAVFGLKAAFDVDRSLIERLCRRSPSTSTDRFLPSQYAPDYFQLRKFATPEEIAGFGAFVDKAIQLSRTDYSALISSLESFWSALQAINYNFEMAYSLLVYSLESLAQKFDSYEPKWEDYEDRVRKDIDELLKPHPALEGRVRTALLNHSHLRLRKRFISFVQHHISDSYFEGEASGIKWPIKRSELERALSNAYESRSRYVHELRPIIPQIKKVPQLAQNDYLHWESEPHITFRGLLRLCTHVIRNFVTRRPIVATETFDWRKDLPGTIQLPMAPQYWIWQPEGFQPSQACKRLSGFLQNIAGLIVRGETLIDLRPLLTKIKEVYDQGSASEKRDMLAIHFIFNISVREQDRSEGYVEFWEKHSKDLTGQCTIESMLCELMAGKKWQWPATETEKALKKYQTDRYKKDRLTVPPHLEIALIIEQANSYLRSGDQQAFKSMMEQAVLEAAGLQEIQEKLRAAIAAGQEVDALTLIAGKRATDPINSDASEGPAAR